MDKDGQKEFARTSPPYGGYASKYFDAIFNAKLMSVEIVADWCCLLGIKNRDVIRQMVETLQLQYKPFNDQIIGFFVNIQHKLEECCELMIDAENKAKREDYFLFVKDILYTLSLLIQCLPTVSVCSFLNE